MVIVHEEMNMALIRDNYFNWLFLVLLVIGFDCNDAEKETNNLNLNQLNFDQVKNDFFNVNFTKYLTEYGYQENFKCLRELNALRKGLSKNELWALKRKQETQEGANICKDSKL